MPDSGHETLHPGDAERTDNLQGCIFFGYIETIPIWVRSLSLANLLISDLLVDLGYRYNVNPSPTALQHRTTTLSPDVILFSTFISLI